MASLLAKIFDFQANIPVTSLDPLDAEFQQLIDVLNGTATGTKVLVKSSDASDPVLELDQLGAGPVIECKVAGTAKVSVLNNGQIASAVATGTQPLVVSSTTRCANLNADLLDGNEASAFALATSKVAFSFTFPIADPSTPTVGAYIPGGAAFVCPLGTAITVTRLQVSYQLGSHTSGGSVEFTVERRTLSGSWADPGAIGSATLSDTFDDKFVVHNFDVNPDLTLAEADTLVCFISARSGTITERNVSVAVIGTQRVF